MYRSCEIHRTKTQYIIHHDCWRNSLSCSQYYLRGWAILLNIVERGLVTLYREKQPNGFIHDKNDKKGSNTMPWGSKLQVFVWFDLTSPVHCVGTWLITIQYESSKTLTWCDCFLYWSCGIVTSISHVPKQYAGLLTLLNLFGQVSSTLSVVLAWMNLWSCIPLHSLIFIKVQHVHK